MRLPIPRLKPEESNTGELITPLELPPRPKATVRKRAELPIQPAQKRERSTSPDNTRMKQKRDKSPAFSRHRQKRRISESDDEYKPVARARTSSPRTMVLRNDPEPMEGSQTCLPSSDDERMTSDDELVNLDIDMRRATYKRGAPPLSDTEAKQQRIESIQLAKWFYHSSC